MTVCLDSDLHIADILIMAHDWFSPIAVGRI